MFPGKSLPDEKAITVRSLGVQVRSCLIELAIPTKGRTMHHGDDLEGNHSYSVARAKPAAAVRRLEKCARFGDSL